MKILNTINEVKEYMHKESKEKAIFLNYNIDFLIMKYIQYKNELSNVVYMYDLLLNIQSNDIKEIYNDYEEDTPFQSDIQTYQNKILKESQQIGEYNGSNIVKYVKYGSTIHYYDPRGFKSSIINNLSNNSQIIYILDEDQNVRYTLIDDMIAGDNFVMNYNKFKEGVVNGTNNCW